MSTFKSYIKRGLGLFLSGNNPNFIIIGAQKSGTTSLHHYLKQHPNLTGSSIKELHYFDQKIHFGYSLNWYKGNFIRTSIRPQLFFESSPSYIYHESIPKQMASSIAGVKLILILRDPVKRAFSAWNMYHDIFDRKRLKRFKRQLRPGEMNPIYKNFFLNRQSFPSFHEAIQIELELIKNGTSIEPSLLRRGLYAQQLKKYYEFFDKKDILVLGFKELITNLNQTLNKVTEFLEVEKISFPEITKSHKNSRKYPQKMTPGEEQFLIDFYKKPNEELFQLIGFKPNW